jgi:carbamoyltransferase
MEEYASDYFDIEGNSPYMLYVFKCKKDIQAIMANDGMSRIQTVNEKQNKHFYNLLKAYKTKYDLPLLLNTSLNMSGLTLAEDLYDIKYMLDYSDLNYCYFPEINKLVS